MTIETVMSEVEKQYYTQLFNGCTSNGTHTDGKLIDLLRNSGMPNDTLKVVWTKYCTNTNGCTRPQFYTIMRVIGLIQAGHREETHGNYLLSRGFNMLPKFNGVNRPVVPEQTTPQSMPIPSFPPIGAQDLQSYEKVIFDVMLLLTSDQDKCSRKS
jgi:hypothetical protein